jgi:type IV secretory pathway TrbD component
VKLARGILIALGLAGLFAGAVILVREERPDQIVGVIIWIVAAIIVHDGILSPLLLLVDVGMRRAGRRIPYAVLAIIQGGVVVGAIMSMLVLPEIYKKSLGTKNPTILPLDYGLNLALFWVAVAVLTAAACALYLRGARRRAAALPPVTSAPVE